MRLDRATVQPVSEAVLRKDQDAAWNREGHHRPGAQTAGDHLSNAEEQMGIRRLREFRVGGGGLMGWTVFFMPRAKTARGKGRRALPRIPARGTPPETPGPLSL